MYEDERKSCGTRTEIKMKDMRINKKVKEIV
jgi:hypothetical protein